MSHVRPCNECGKTRRIHHQGRCTVCYNREYVAAKTSTNAGRQYLSSDVVLEEWEFLRDYFNYTPEAAAAKLGMTWPAFDRALWRAEKKGDPRARRPKVAA